MDAVIIDFSLNPPHLGEQHKYSPNYFAPCTHKGVWELVCLKVYRPVGLYGLNIHSRSVY